MSKSSAASSWREARRRNARADLVATAWEIVRAEGLGGLSLRDLARRAGITTPTVYAYFESKNAIFDAMFEEAAQSFAHTKSESVTAESVTAESVKAEDPESTLVADARRFVDFCTSDVARYQLLFQHSIPGFVPSARAYAPALRALQVTREMLSRSGVRNSAHWDIWTALMIGLVDQQIANDPGGDRWSRLVDEVVAMFLAHCAMSASHATPDRPSRSQTKKRSPHA